jgi:HlyD family secretion protein
MTKKKRLLLIIGAAVILIGLITAALLTNQEKMIPVTIEKVENGKIVSIVTANGKVEAKTNVNISSDVMGKIIEIPVVEGQNVKKGQLLVAIDKTQSVSEVDQMKALLAAAEADREQARINFDRQAALFERKLISQYEYDVAKNTLDRAIQAVNQYRASLEIAKDQLSKFTIRAPIDGTITDLISKVGENVLIGTMNNAGTVIMVLSDLSEIVVKADVDETDIASLAIGQDVEISLDAFPDTTFKGKVTEIGNAAKTSAYGVQDQVTNFEVTILITDSVPGIKPGMNASVDITTNIRENVLKIPIQAVVMRAPEDTIKGAMVKAFKPVAEDEKDKPLSSKVKKSSSKDEMEGVFVVEKNVARFVPIKTGISDQQYIEVVNGLSENQEIVTGSFKTLRTLKQGDKVKAKPKTSFDIKEKD